MMKCPSCKDDLYMDHPKERICKGCNISSSPHVVVVCSMCGHNISDGSSAISWTRVPDAVIFNKGTRYKMRAPIGMTDKFRSISN